MRRVKFYFRKDMRFSPSEEIFEYEDGITEEEIQADYEEWVWNEIIDMTYREDVTNIE